MTTTTAPQQLRVRLDTNRVEINRAELIRAYEIKMLTAIRNYETQKANYEAVQKAYTEPGGDQITATFRAGSDPRIAEASGLAAWYRDEAQLYAAAVTALRGGLR